MSNMSDCRFKNTLKDLIDCIDNFDDEELSQSEARARWQLLKVCRDIVDDYEEMLDEEKP